MDVGVGRWVAEQFEASRPRLRAIAYRMLGSAAEADDAVQEAWLRLSRTGPENIDNLGGWLTTVVSRVCLDMLRARRSRREEPVGNYVPEAVSDGDEVEQPDHELLLADSIGPALVVVLDSLEPHERVAFVLHDLFGVPFAEIAPVVGRSPTATRQLASRARRRLRGRSEPPDADHVAVAGGDTRRRELVEAFLAASRRGDFQALFAVLDPDVVLRADPVAVRSATARQARGAPALREEVRGREAVAQLFAGRAAAAQAALINGTPGVVWAPEGRVRSAFVMRWREGRIVEIEVVFDPRRLRNLEIVL